MKAGSFCFIIILAIQSCTTKDNNKPIYKEKYGFIQKERYMLLDSARLSAFQGTLFLFQPAIIGNPYIELIRIDSTREEILIPAKDECFMPNGLQMNCSIYDFNFQDLEKYLNEHRDKFKDIAFYKKDFETIFLDNIKLRNGDLNLKYFPPQSHCDSIPIGYIHHLKDQQLLVSVFTKTSQHFHTCEQFFLIGPGFIHRSHSDYSDSNSDFFLIRDIAYSYDKKDSEAVIKTIKTGPYVIYYD